MLNLSVWIFAFCFIFLGRILNGGYVSDAQAADCTVNWGDYDTNGIVDTADLMNWYMSYRNSYIVKADFNCDSKVDIFDLLVWYKSYKNGLLAGSDEYSQGFEEATVPSDFIISGNTTDNSVFSSANSLAYEGNNVLGLDYRKDYVRVEKIIENEDLKTNISFKVQFYDPGTTLQRGFQIRAYDSVSGEEFLIGVYSTFNNSNYFIRPGKPGISFFDTKIARTTGWHKAEIRITEFGSFGLIDDKNMIYLPNVNGQAPINTKLTKITNLGMTATWNYFGEYLIDDVKISKLDSISSIEEISRNFISEYLENRDINQFGSDTQLTIDPESQKNLYVFKTDISRSFANFTLAKAFDCRFNKGFQQDCVNEVALLLHSLFKKENFDNWKGNRVPGVGFAWSSNHFMYPNSPLADYPAALSAWLVWDKLPNYDADGENPSWKVKSLVYSRLTTEADFWSTHPEIGRIFDSSLGNSSAEELAWTGAFLTIVGNMQNRTDWLIKGTWMFNEALRDENSGGDGYILCNHNYCPHPGYAIYTLASMSEGLVGYKLLNKDYLNLLNKSNLDSFVKTNIGPSIVDNKTYRYINNVFNGSFGGKDDWFRSPETNSMSAYSLLSNLNVIIDNVTPNINYSSELERLGRFRLVTNQTSFIPYKLSKEEISVLSNYDVVSSPFRPTIELTEVLYNVVTNLWSNNIQLSLITTD